jgi:hypothetical protein
MIYLKIENGKGYFFKEPDRWIEIDQIGKEDLLVLLDKAIADEFEMVQYDAELLHNKAHQIVYKHLFQMFNELNDNKSRFKDESEQLYKSAIEKYTEAIEANGYV